MKAQLFYSVFRNIYLTRLIRNQIFKDQIIDVVDLQYLNHNHVYLSSILDKGSSVFVKLKIQRNEFHQYKDNSYYYMINYLVLDLKQDESECFDLTLVPKSVCRLSIIIDQHTQVNGILPDTITDLEIKSVNILDHSFVVESMVSKLPKNIKRLAIPYNYRFKWSGPIVLPLSLDDFEYFCLYQDAKRLVIDKSKVFASAQVQVNRIEELNWVYGQKWVQNIHVRGCPDGMLGSQTPGHIKRMNILNYKPDTIHKDFLPRGLKHLQLHYLGSLSEDFLPPSLTYLKVSFFNQELESNYLPGHLKTLYLLNFEKPIRCSVLGLSVFPPGLHFLYLPKFNQPLTMGCLPESLAVLKLMSYNQPLGPFVLPRQLKILELDSYTHPLVNDCLPSCLTHLQLPSFKGSFESIGPLNHLQSLTVFKLNHTVTPTISNVKDLQLMFDEIQDWELEINLQNTSIKRLAIFITGKDRFLSRNLLPFGLVKLKINGFKIETSEIIPTSCIYLETDIIDINPDLIPASVKYYKYRCL
ncbi:hypothetical protein CYY_000233 [Polysphondylium violaceum]|uniref:FNIP repeat-containing protein n=1 Tax=Polysphondylium violaceum TaxID=133409 RepID=A0A8J4Q059_9MYCE|nr:hypothetical protein CYY_000233 [Polysphondylium violaceum]